MVSHAENADSLPPSPPKPLAGVGIVIVENGTTLGVVFAPNAMKLQALLQAIHGQALTFNLSEIRGGTLTLEHPPK